MNEWKFIFHPTNTYQIPSSKATGNKQNSYSSCLCGGYISRKNYPISYLIRTVMSNMNKKYRCCISAEPDKGSFTENMTFTEVETIQKKQVENGEWFKQEDKM